MSEEQQVLNILCKCKESLNKEHLANRLREFENIKFKVEGAIETIMILLKELEIENAKKTAKPKARKKAKDGV